MGRLKIHSFLNGKRLHTNFDHVFPALYVALIAASNFCMENCRYTPRELTVLQDRNLVATSSNTSRYRSLCFFLFTYIPVVNLSLELVKCDANETKEQSYCE